MTPSPSFPQIFTRLFCRRTFLVPLLVACLIARPLALAAFTPLSALECKNAIGDASAEPAQLQRLLEPDGDFPPIHVPQFGDWLTTYYEPGQTYANYADSPFNRPSAQRRIIYLQPIGEFPPEISPPLNDLKAYAEAYFQLDVRILPAISADQPEFKSRTNEFTQKPQLLTLSIMDYLKKQLPGDAYCLLGVTMTDLYPAANWNFVFGQASLSERIGIYSFARYDPAFLGQKRGNDFQQLILKRSCKVLAHETGHMFGLHHCIYYECQMNGSNNLGEADLSPQYLCPVCLRKLHFNVQFDPEARYKDLAKFYRDHGWDEEVSWTEHQLEKAHAP